MSRLGPRVRRLRERASDDSGTSLMELVVGMVVMTVFMTLFTGAMVSLARTTTKVEAVASSAGQVNNSFLGLDRLVRYASAVTTPGRGVATGDWYVELDSFLNAVERCAQLRVDVATQQLQQRSWTVSGSTSYADLSAWRPLADNVLNATATAGSADVPFAFPATTPSSSLQRLTITLVSGTSGPSSTSTTRSSLGFTALNSSVSDATNATRCQQLGTTGYRP